MMQLEKTNILACFIIVRGTMNNERGQDDRFV